ncbi:Alcohol dehydrogenase 1 [Capsicum annuum]|uniref:alcohol dehydrogenase n=1 Tax=Capsicum annuum TaxID=4072 RepID=A0A2G2Z9W5_CAPAN|nr:Alcohol dehydrogenase 1 [Capsicum annuum]
MLHVIVLFCYSLFLFVFVIICCFLFLVLLLVLFLNYIGLFFLDSKTASLSVSFAYTLPSPDLILWDYIGYCYCCCRQMLQVNQFLFLKVPLTNFRAKIQSFLEFLDMKQQGMIVESVGEGVIELAPGDHVLPVFTGECKDCSHCKSEESNMCSLLRINTDRGVMIHDGQSRFSINGKPIYHFVGTSTFSEYTVVHVGCVAKINPLAPLDKVCVLSCGISTGLGATLNVAKPTKGSSVAIFGLGAVGLAAAEGARIAGVSRIIGVDLNASRFEQAKKFGVTEFVNPKDHSKPVQEIIAEMTDGGVDRSVECTGHIDAMISAFECVHDGWGVAVLVGVPHKEAVFKTHPMNLLNERTLKGTFFGNYKPRSDLPSVVEKYMNRELELEKFITHTLPFAQINKAFDLMLKGEGLRCIITMED